MQTLPDTVEMSNAERLRKIADLGRVIANLRLQLDKPNPTGTKDNWGLSVQLQKIKAQREALTRQLPPLRIVGAV